MSWNIIDASWIQSSTGRKGILKAMGLHWTPEGLTCSFGSKTTQKRSLYVCYLHLPTSHVFLKPLWPVVKSSLLIKISLVEVLESPCITELGGHFSVKHSTQWTTPSSLKYSFQVLMKPVSLLPFALPVTLPHSLLLTSLALMGSGFCLAEGSPFIFSLEIFLPGLWPQYCLFTEVDEKGVL